MNEREKWSTLKDVQEYLGVGRESIFVPAELPMKSQM